MYPEMDEWGGFASYDWALEAWLMETERHIKVSADHADELFKLVYEDEVASGIRQLEAL
jgi:hypothetical protein